MPRAIQTASLIPDSAPTVAALGAHLADVRRAIDAFSEDHFPEHGADAADACLARDILYERADGLRMVIATMVATTLPEAAIQLALINGYAERISSLSGEQSEDAAQNIERLILSAFPVVAAEAGLNIETMGWSELLSLRDKRFAGVGLQS